MIDDKKVKMIQHSKYRWVLVSAKGHVLKDDLLLANEYRAKLWIESYVSSFNGWSYEIVPMTHGGEGSDN